MKQLTNRPLKCLIINEENAVHKTIKSHINKISWLDFSDGCTNAVRGLQVLAAHDYDVIFLDVDMSYLSGSEFLHIAGDTGASVVVTTTHIKFGIDRFDHDVADFLLKPISFDSFLKTANKVRHQREAITPKQDYLNQDQQTNDSSQHFEQIFENKDTPDKILRYPKYSPVFGEKIMWVRVDKNVVSVEYQHLYMVRGWGNYVRLYTESQILCVRTSLGLLTQSLPANFIKTHKSYIVNRELIKHFSGNEVVMRGGQYKAKISRHMRGDVFKNL